MNNNIPDKSQTSLRRYRTAPAYQTGSEDSLEAFNPTRSSSRDLATVSARSNEPNDLPGAETEADEYESNSEDYEDSDSQDHDSLNQEDELAAAFDLQTRDITQVLDLEEPSPRIWRAANEHLGDYIDPLPVVVEVEEEEDGDQQRGGDTRRYELELHAAGPQLRRHSLPAKVLKSAIAIQPHQGKPKGQGNVTKEERKARFKDELPVDPRRLPRRNTAPGELRQDDSVTAFDTSSGTSTDEDDDSQSSLLLHCKESCEEGETEPEDEQLQSLEPRFRGRVNTDALLEAEDAAGEFLEDEIMREDASKTVATLSQSEDGDLLIEDDADPSVVDVEDDDSTSLRYSPSPAAIIQDAQQNHRDDFDPNDHFRRLTIAPLRRLSESHANQPKGGITLEARRRASSMSSFIRLQDRARCGWVTPKGRLADCAVTVCSVRAADSPKLATVYEQLLAQIKPSNGGDSPNRTAQTVSSGTSTYHLIWEDTPSEGSGGGTSMYVENGSQAQEPDPEGPSAYASRSPSPMRQVGTKLAAWSWAREQDLDEDGLSRWSPLMAYDDTGIAMRSNMSPESEEPPAPPNTEKCSGASSARHVTPWGSDPASPGDEFEPEELTAEAGTDDGEQDSPTDIHLKANTLRRATADASLDRPDMSRRTRSVPEMPSPSQLFPRQLSNLANEDAHFRFHRDSLELSHRKLNEDRMNQHLMNARDSFVITKSKYEARMGRGAAGPAIAYSRFGGLETIADASPPDVRRQQGVSGMSKLAERRDGEGVEYENMGLRGI